MYHNFSLIILFGIVSLGVFGYSQDADALSTDYLYEFGTTGNGQLIAPVQASLNSDDIVYVIENGNDRVSVFDSDGEFQFKFGAYGTGNGQFIDPAGIVVGPSDKVYVLDKNNRRVQVFDAAGTYLSQFGSIGSADGQFNLPQGIAVDKSENIYIADTFNQRIQKFDSNGDHLLTFGDGLGNLPGQFKEPSALAISESGDIYVTDTRNHRVQVFNSVGEFQFQIGSFGTGDGQFGLLTRGIGIDNDGNVFVGDFHAHRYQVFDLSGNFIKTFGSFGPGQFNGALASPGFDSEGKIYIAESRNNRIQVFGSLEPVDTVPPVVTVSSEIAEATSSSGANVSFIVTSIDDVDGSITPSCNAISGDVFTITSTIVTCTATDAAGNEGTGSGTITVQDTTFPVVTTSENIQTVATSYDGANVIYPDSIATDVVSVPDGPTCDVSSGSLFAIGETTITCVAEDAAGNVGESSFTVTVNQAVLQTQKLFAIDTLNDLKVDAIEKKTTKGIDKAIKKITKSIDDKLWDIDGDTLTKKGKKVFNEEKKAVKELLKIIKKDKESDSFNAGISGVIDQLVRIDSELANNAFTDAQAFAGEKKADKEIAKADKALKKATDELAKGKPDKAIDNFKKAWEHSQHAMKSDKKNHDDEDD